MTEIMTENMDKLEPQVEGLENRLKELNKKYWVLDGLVDILSEHVDLLNPERLRDFIDSRVEAAMEVNNEKQRG